MQNDIKEVLVSTEQIKNICKELGQKISNDYEGRCPVLIGLLKGCEPFMSNLVQNIDVYCRLDYMRVSSYEGGTSSTGNILIKSDISTDVSGKDIIIIDDIIDSGRSALMVKNLLEQRGAKSVEICALLDKPEGRVVHVDVKYIGTRIPNEFVIGYGLDYNELYRNLPYIGVLKEEIYK